MSLIKTSAIRCLWEDAQGSLEHSSTRFWEYLFKQVFFNGPEWNIPSQQPYTPLAGDLRRSDAIVERYDSAKKKWETILFYEAKLDSASEDEIHTCEVQAQTASWAFLNHFPERGAIYAMTTWGTKARLWIYIRDDKNLMPKFPNDGDYYVEASSDAAAGLKKELRNLHKWEDPGTSRSNTSGSGIPGSSGSGPSNPGPSNPGPSKPGPSNPGPSNPGPSYQGPSTRESTVTSQETTTSAGQLPAPVLVETWHYKDKKNHVYYKFRNPDSGKDIKTEASEWKAGWIDGTPCSIYTGKSTGRQYYVWELGTIRAPK